MSTSELRLNSGGLTKRIGASLVSNCCGELLGANKVLKSPTLVEVQGTAGKGDLFKVVVKTGAKRDIRW